MKISNKFWIRLTALILLSGFIGTSLLKGKINSPILSSHKKSLNLSAEPFFFTQDFEASSYYISPEASPGSQDGVFFSFAINKNGNFSISVNNFPSELTSTIELEQHVAFDNPSGTDLWYLSYIEMDIEFEAQTINRIGTYKLKLLISDDKGRKWEEKTMFEFFPSGSNYAELFYDLIGTGISAYPELGLITGISWYNFSDLVFVSSVDNGSTWNAPTTITKAADIGANTLFNPFKGWYPYIDVCILKNSTIYVMSQANLPIYTPLVYFESHDNGISWSAPKNITIAHGNYLRKAKLQVDHFTGNYWLMWMYTNDSLNFHIEWAEFKESNKETLKSNVPVNPIYTGKDCNFDFLFDWYGPVFRVIRINPIGVSYPFDEYEVLNYTCTNFGNPWEVRPLGVHVVLEDLWHSYATLNFGFDGNTFQLFYEAFYTGFTEVYQYYLFKNPIFWEDNGLFMREEPIQRFWNGRINNTIPITISTVKVDLIAQNDTEVISSTKYLTIDNEYPYFEDYVQNKHYFNPISSNITLTEINWDLLASEECTAFLEVFKHGISWSDWQKVTNNNLHELSPQIFRSDWGDLYILYRTVELGTKIIYLIKSHDNGITWSDPVEITRILSDSSDFRYKGAAWGPVITIYVRDVDSGEDKLYRSFNGGEFFEPPIIMTDLVVNDKVEKLIMTNNGTLFLLHRNYPSLYTMLKSNDLGFNWVISQQWLDYPPNFTTPYDMEADMVYDNENDLIHVVLPYLNNTLVANYSVATLDVLNGTWREPKGTGTIYPMGNLRRAPKLLLTRTEMPPFVQIKIIYIEEQIPMGSWTNYIVKQIESNDLGETWSGPVLVEDSNNATEFTSSIFDIFYVSQKSDGNDYEIYFSREGGLTRTKKETISSGSYSKITFDGLDDFGSYLSEGNYTYILHLRDDAGNFINTEGWFFVDHYAPIISDTGITDPLDFTPTPRLDVEITTTITDLIEFSASICYKTEFSGWEQIPMENIGGNSYRGVIPSDNNTDWIQYYIKAVDLAGNVQIDDRVTYNYDMPRYYLDWANIGLFNETSTYSSTQSYEISIIINTDLEYVESIVFRYSTDGGTTWIYLELVSSSPEFSGILADIPDDTRTLYYEVIIYDIFGVEFTLVEQQQISFYPEIPSLSISGSGAILVGAIASIVGFLVAYGYIKLKGKSHDVIYKQIFLREYARKSIRIEEKSDRLEKKQFKKRKKKELSDEKGILSGASIGTSPFTIAYLGILSATLAVFFFGYVLADLNPQGGILLLAASLVLSIFGYMILISRDISLNIYLEKIFKRNILLEFFQIGFMLLNIIMILFRGYEIPWFRYYLIEQTYDIGTISIPKLYISVFGVFFTSLVLVMITTYLQLKKTVKNLREQRSQGASDNVLLYSKDQNSSRLITQMGYKTIAFLVTVLIGIVTTTNLLTVETGMALLVVVIPFIIAGFSALIVNRVMEIKKKEDEAEKIELPFIDSGKICNNCGASIYLSNKHCGSCGKKVVFTENVGIYNAKCPECDGYIYDGADFCPTCGLKLEKQK